MSPAPDIDTLTPVVARVLRIDDVTWGDSQKNFLVRYRGQLYGEDTAAAYDQLATSLRPLNITPLFRLEDKRHVVILMPGVIRPRTSSISWNIALLALTIFSTFLVGAANDYAGSGDIFTVYKYALANLWRGWPFAVSLMAILLAHEFGHYLVGRFHHTAVTLPYFLPMPIPGSFGTLGAFIQLKEVPKNRRILLDIGVAGPLAGLIVAIPVLLIGLRLSSIDPIPLFFQAGQGIQVEGNSILYLLLKYSIFHQLLPHPASYAGLSPLLFWVRYFFTGLPAPLGGTDVMLSPIAWAGWVGLLVTSLNLIPAGQLDGGHLLYVLAGRRAARIVPIILLLLILMGLVWPGWWLWAFLIFIFGRIYAEPLDQITQLDGRRKAIALLGLLIFILVFIPVPLRVFGGI